MQQSLLKTVSIITVNYNQTAVTEALLASIEATNDYTAIEIIVVDNASSIDPVHGWATKYPSVKFIRSETNLGFAGGNNLGIKVAAGDYLFFVNNDTEFTKGLVEELTRTLDSHPEIGIISPKIRYYDKPGMLQYAGFTKMNYYTARNKCIGYREQDNGQHDDLTGETGYIHGAAMMVRRDAIEKAGAMPEEFFLYYEEMDWCEHIRRAGYTIWVDVQALILHKESLSVGPNSPLKEYYMNRNRMLFIRRNCGLFTRFIFVAYFMTVVVPRNILGYIKDGRLNFIGILFRAIGWNITHRAYSKRKHTLVN